MTKQIITSLCLLVGLALSGAMGYMQSDFSKVTHGKVEENKATMESQQQMIRNSQEERQVIINLYHAMYSYMLKKDIDHLTGMLSDDFVLVHMTGMRQPKKEYLRCIEEGELNYFTEETEHIDIELHGDTAVLIGQSRVNAAVFGGGRHTWPLQLKITMKKQDDKWIMTGAQASTY